MQNFWIGRERKEKIEKKILGKEIFMRKETKREVKVRGTEKGRGIETLSQALLWLNLSLQQRRLCMLARRITMIRQRN